jgi:hypothetical protein
LRPFAGLLTTCKGINKPNNLNALKRLKIIQMETSKICKEYFDMHKAILKERQFNRKVELNIKISNFKRLNNISLECKDLDTEIFIQNKMIGVIKPLYAKKDKNLECKFIRYNYQIIKN